MKRKHQRTLETIFAHPTGANVQWRDVEALFRELGAEVSEREGSRVAVVLLSSAMNTMTVDGFHAKIEYDAELDQFRGEILGLTGGADFYGKNPRELRAEFKRSLAVFLEVCREKGIEPRRSYSGKFNLRISPDLHEKLAIAAQAEGKSINTLAQEALEQRVAA
jgi:predicted HicB family RNase H-like nuclease